MCEVLEQKDWVNGALGTRAIKEILSKRLFKVRLRWNDTHRRGRDFEIDGATYLGPGAGRRNWGACSLGCLKGEAVDTLDASCVFIANNRTSGTLKVTFYLWNNFHCLWKVTKLLSPGKPPDLKTRWLVECYFGPVFDQCTTRG